MGTLVGYQDLVPDIQSKEFFLNSIFGTNFHRLQWQLHHRRCNDTTFYTGFRINRQACGAVARYFVFYFAVHCHSLEVQICALWLGVVEITNRGKEDTPEKSWDSKTSHTGLSCIHPPLQHAPLQLPSPHHSPPIPEILHLYSAAVWLTQPILLHRNLEEETPSLLLLCSLPSLEDYQDSFTMLLELARSSHSHCVPEFTQPVEKREERKRKGGREKPAEYQWQN